MTKIKWPCPRNGGLPCGYYWEEWETRTHYPSILVDHAFPAENHHDWRRHWLDPVNRLHIYLSPCVLEKDHEDDSHLIQTRWRRFRLSLDSYTDEEWAEIERQWAEEDEEDDRLRHVSGGGSE